MMLIPLFGPIGPEILVILLLVVLLFGANRIPKLARATGESLGQFRKGRQEAETELNSPPTTETNSDTTNLQVISGIGDEYETEIKNAGVQSVEELSQSNTEEITQHTDISEGKVQNWIEEAQQKTS